MSEKAHLLIIDDEKNYLLVLQTLLEDEGYAVTAISDPETALAFLDESEVDVVVTDMKMPKVTGREVLERVKKNWPYIPVLIMTAFGSIESAVKVMKYGAFDYITKPFGIMEFLSRVRAALRRSAPEARPNVLSFHEILLDNARHNVTVSGTPVELTYKEYSLLRLLLENTNLVVTRETILQVVWGTDISVESRTVDMHIRTLRKKLGDAGKYICTVRKVGYKLTDEEEAGEE